jgi:two-component system, cell cycle response regulator DivK
LSEITEYFLPASRFAEGGPLIAANQAPVMATILVVEDNELNRDMLTRRLQRRGYETLMAEDGVQGLEAARQSRPSLILMDMSLPVMDGWEATKRLKGSPETSGIPIVALTAHAMSGDRERALEAGCDDYDTKPVEFPRLILKIETLLKSAIDPAA